MHLMRQAREPRCWKGVHPRSQEVNAEGEWSVRAWAFPSGSRYSLSTSFSPRTDAGNLKCRCNLSPVFLFLN